MTSALDKLTKILNLEEEQGYRDKAVIGGMRRFADAWYEQAEQEIENLKAAYDHVATLPTLETPPILTEEVIKSIHEGQEDIKSGRVKELHTLLKEEASSL